jgi:hypothetical protein
MTGELIALAYRHAHDIKRVVADLGAVQKFIRPTASGRSARSSSSTAP